MKLETAAKEAHRTWTLVGAIQSDRCSGIRIRTRSGTPYVACKLLDEWHNAHPPGKPPCVYEAADSPQRKWKVFDRNGKELKYTIYRIHCKTTPPYPVLVLHDLGSTDSLVGSIDQSAMKPFLAAWKGKDDAFEDGISAVRIFGNSYEQITFHRGVFYNVQSPRPSGSSVPSKTQSSSGTNISTPRSHRNGSNASSTNASNPETEESSSELSEPDMCSSDIEK